VKIWCVPCRVLLHGAVYGVIDQVLWRPASVDGDRGLNFFLRASAAPSDRNPINLYFDTGLSPRRSRTQSARPERLADPECYGHRCADDPEIPIVRSF
jgi:hypothetical protein